MPGIEASEEILTEGIAIARGTLQGWGDGFYALLPNLVVGAVLLVFFGALAWLAGRGTRHYFERRDRIDLGHVLRNLVFMLVMLIGVLIVFTVIMPSMRPSDLLASVGIGSIAAGFAFKDILQNWFSGLLILLRLPFRRGDQIIVLGVEGTVARIEPRATVIRTYDNRDVVVPNTQIYSNIITVNTLQPTRRIEMDFTVGYNYDVRRITRMISTALEMVDEIRKDPPPQIMCWTLGPTSLGIKLRWWISSERAQEIISRARAVQAIKEAFEAGGIDPTDPQLVFYQSAGPGMGLPFAESVEGEGGKAAPPLRMPPDPPEFTASAADPESEQPKTDSLQRTLLPGCDEPTVKKGPA